MGYLNRLGQDKTVMAFIFFDQSEKKIKLFVCRGWRRRKMFGHACHNNQWLLDEFCGIGSPTLCGFWRSNSGHQAYVTGERIAVVNKGQGLGKVENV